MTDLLVYKVSGGRKVKWAHREPLDCWGHRALQDRLASQAPLDPEAPRVYLERSASRENRGTPGRRAHLERTGRVEHQACRAPRASQEREEKTVCLESPVLGAKLGSRAWRADLERRERPVSRARQDSRA